MQMAMDPPELFWQSFPRFQSQELNIGVSLSLWRALQDERLDDCRRLLQEKVHGTSVGLG